MTSVSGVVVPIFGTVALGYGLARAGWFDYAVGRGLAQFTFLLAIPAMLFQSIAAATLPAALPWAFLLAFYLPVLAIFAAGTALARRRFGWSAREATMAGMTAAYANIVLLGFPLVTAALGEAALLPLFVLLATQSLVLFPLTTWRLEVTRSPGTGLPWRRLLALARNPVLVSLVLGLLANRSGWQPDAVSARILRLIGAAGPGCALIALGVSLAQYRLRGGGAIVVWLVALKNLACPAAVWGAGSLAGLPPTWHLVAVLLAAMPSGVNAFVFASRYALREDEVAKTIVLSTALSALVASVLLALLVPAS